MKCPALVSVRYFRPSAARSPSSATPTSGRAVPVPGTAPSPRPFRPRRPMGAGAGSPVMAAPVLRPWAQRSSACRRRAPVSSRRHGHRARPGRGAPRWRGEEGMRGRACGRTALGPRYPGDLRAGRGRGCCLAAGIACGRCLPCWPWCLPCGSGTGWAGGSVPALARRCVKGRRAAKESGPGVSEDKVGEAGGAAGCSVRKSEQICTLLGKM